MLERLVAAIPAIIGGSTVMGPVLVFLGGLVTSIGPCNLGMVPVIVGYVGGQAAADRGRSFWLSLFFTLGSSTTFVLLGIVVALVGGIFGFARTVLFCVAALVCVAVGLGLLRVWRVNMRWFAGLPERVAGRKGLLGAFLVGMAVGLAGSQCGTPVLLAILSLAMLQGRVAYGAVLLFCYALGRGVPVVAAGTFTGLVKSMPAIARWSHVLESVAGVVLVLVGAYFLWLA